MRVSSWVAATLFLLFIVTMIPSPNAATITPMQANLIPPKFANWTAWLESISKTPTQGAGCFVATYPNPVWQETQCGAPASGDETPSHTTTTDSGGDGLDEVVGNGHNYVAESPSTLIGNAIGALANVTGVTSETDVPCSGVPVVCGGKGGQGPNAYSLQLNTQGGIAGQGFPVNSPYSDNAKVTGWEQFMFLNTEKRTQRDFTGIFIEYWLQGYNKVNCPQDGSGGCCDRIPTPPNTPPSGVWQTDDLGNCFAATDKMRVPFISAKDLSGLWLQASADFNGNDRVMFCALRFSKCFSFSNPANILNMYEHWHLAEFNVVGYVDGSQAQFNSGTEITVGIGIQDHQWKPIMPVTPCPINGQTGETNNLYLSPCSIQQKSGLGLPVNSMVFTERNTEGNASGTSTFASLDKVEAVIIDDAVCCDCVRSFRIMYMI